MKCFWYKLKKGFKIYFQERRVNRIYYKWWKINWTNINKSFLSNAIKFTNKGKIEFIINDKNEYIEFIVRDEGIGISNDKFDYIFEKI